MDKDRTIVHLKKVVTKFQTDVNKLWDDFEHLGFKWEGKPTTPKKAMRQIIKIAVAKDRAKRKQTRT